ncbi:hypothetical protein A2483_01595 [Candidatus Peregrinibacteria bacterium RIFOXYC2_FULL_33_13]|nr:MAG: hypothetical protein UR27_C0024G0002 [Candidatus Peregrinibacteria bacterium GW2011_GWA2_33_10]KKP38294.1 MAG: hypothetical protein UR30_C0021G0002 [Candidatus Peregrinibacteria bacterium GW2011_GWC2_33_13]OGJ55316.1 MAG: hypothetical protein A2483_01595 [Candidatus Peregrinibacteria bacterium RIFOXYC2_FULL_33_13]
MNTTISIDKKIRDKAARKAQDDQLSVSAVIRILLNDYADGKIQIGTRMVGEPMIEVIEVDKSTQNLMDDVVNAWNKK